MTMNSMKRRFGILGAAAIFLAALLYVEDTFQYSNFLLLRGRSEERYLSIDLGDGKCIYTFPEQAPADDDPIFHTLVVGFPGSGKRDAYKQLGGVTGLITGDDFDLSLNHDQVGFMKTSFPHHEGIWSWDDKMDQAIMIIRNPRWTLPSYHDLLFEIEYAKNWEEAYAREGNVYTGTSPIENWLEWRDTYAEQEARRWGWFIDFYMENGLHRNDETHELINSSEWKSVADPTLLEDGTHLHRKLNQELSYDSHCILDMTCTPVTIVSYEKLTSNVTGPDEAAKMFEQIEDKDGMNIISREAWPCIWEELQVNRKGITTFFDRHGPPPEAYNFTFSQISVIHEELTRLRTKYGSGNWTNNTLAGQLVGYLDEYIVDVSDEMSAMNASQYNSTES